MKTRLLWILLAFASATQAANLAPSAPVVLAPLPQEAQAANLTAQILTRHHYKAMPLDNAMSELIFERYLKAMDPEKLFFVQADVDSFSFARNLLDDVIYQGDLQIPFNMFNLYEQRVAQRLTFARELLKQNLDFDRKESYQFDRSKAQWAKSEEALRDLWRKRVKNDWLRLKLAGKEDKTIRDTLDKRYVNSLNRANKVKSEDVFDMFMNAYATAVEPHTDYLGPKASKEFDIEMRLSLVGIGGVLQQRDEYTTIRELVPGGPAALSAKIQLGDRIVGVGQGKDGAVTEVVGWPINDVVDLIRGPKESVVRLDILPADAGPDDKPKRISLVRDKISLEQQAAKKSVMQVQDGTSMHQVGIIALPAFYQDFDARNKGDKNYKSATSDVARLLGELKKDKVDSVVIDLRNNGGGSLDEAVSLTSLFTGKGPVVQERDSDGHVRVESGNNAAPAWDGPVAVLINRGSASASEIFAAAIQDYGRGIIIGEPSFGKGTVQNVISLNELARNEKAKLGDLKMTIAQFFRINGGTTQLRGVTPDIQLPSASDAEHFGESSYDNALPWIQINAARYTPSGNLTEVLPLLQSRHAARIAKDKDYQYLLEDIAVLKSQREKQQISLNQTERRKERTLQEARLKLRAQSKLADGSSQSAKSAKETAATLNITAQQDSGLESGERNLSDELAAEKALKDAKDVWLNESVHILSDEVTLLKSDATLSAQVARRAQ